MRDAMPPEIPPETKGLTQVHCRCGRTHHFSPTAMAILLVMLQDGDGHAINRNGVEPFCLADILATLSDDDSRRATYRGRIIGIR